MDYGLFLQSIMLAAVEQGLASCPQASIAGYSETIKTTLDYPQNILLLCGMSLGYEDKMHWWIPIEHRVKKLVHLHGISNNTDKLLLVFFSVNAYFNRDYSKSLWKRVFFNLKCLLDIQPRTSIETINFNRDWPFWILILVGSTNSYRKEGIWHMIRICRTYKKC